ncbi:MAG: hypothetical protein AAB628_00900 [Patescibacteria group bacterium]
MEKKIGVDLDDVLMACNEAICLWHNANYGTSYTKKDVVSYEFNRVWGCTTEEAAARVHKFFHSEEHSRALPVSGAVSGIRFLGEENIHIITARPLMISGLTTKWLEKYFPDMVERIHFVGKEQEYSHHQTTKPEICKSLGIEIFVDDALVHARGVAAAGIQVLLFDNPWNQVDELPKNVERVYSWDEIIEKLQ